MRPLLTVALIALLAAYGYNVTRNIRAADELDVRCEALLAQVRGLTEQQGLALIVGPTLGEDMLALHAGRCDHAREAMTWWRWNLGRELEMPRDPERDERIRASLEEAKARCPQVIAAALQEMSQALGGQISPAEQAAQIEQLCGAFDGASAQWGAAPALSAPVWDWPDRLAGAPAGAP